MTSSQQWATLRQSLFKTNHLAIFEVPKGNFLTGTEGWSDFLRTIIFVLGRQMAVQGAGTDAHQAG